MQPLKNERHERFAQMVALGSSHTQAYIAAGYGRKAARECAARLLTRVNIRSRISFLQARAADRVDITLDSLVADAARCRDLGIWHGQINAAVLAVKELGILTGFRVERRETRTIDPATISDEELAAIIRAGPPVDVTVIREEARARLEAPPVTAIGVSPKHPIEAQPADHDGVDNGIANVSPEQNAAKSTTSGKRSKDTSASKPPVLPRDIPIDRPVAPGTIEKAIRGLRRGRATSAPRPDLDEKSKA